MPPVDLTVTDLQRHTLPGGDVWILATRLPGGDLFHHVFPVDTLEWRAAEYGIDPDDVDQLLAIVLAEPWMADGHDHNHEHSLHNAPTIDQAREHHLGRVRQVHDQRRWNVPPGVRRRIRDESPRDHDTIRLKARLVNHQRAQHRQRGNVAASADTDRPDPLKPRERP